MHHTDGGLAQDLPWMVKKKFVASLIRVADGLNVYNLGSFKLEKYESPFFFGCGN